MSIDPRLLADLEKLKAHHEFTLEDGEQAPDDMPLPDDHDLEAGDIRALLSLIEGQQAGAGLREALEAAREVLENPRMDYEARIKAAKSVIEPALANTLPARSFEEGVEEAAKVAEAFEAPNRDQASLRFTKADIAAAIRAIAKPCIEMGGGEGNG